uniref:Uncharacterized protein n=1 Tax=Anopheles dirus TaxID=7168 RepID=A0A182ND40_9DIPT
MAIVKDSATFFQHGNSAQFDYVLKLYPKALKLKAETRGNGKKADKLMRLEKWYQNELPKLIKNRGRDAHLSHEELVQTMEWKQTRGKFYPQLSYLIKINTPRAVVMETKKAFRKLPNLEQALNALSNLKGVGITMASALLAAAAPESAPFMADECLMAIPDIEGIDYTTKEYLKFVTHIQQTMERLNLEVESNGAAEQAADSADEKKDSTTNGGGGDVGGGTVEPAAGEEGSESGSSGAATAAKESSGKDEKSSAAENGKTEPKAKKWSAHSVELALWTHYVVSDLEPELLGGMPGNGNGVAGDATPNGISKDEEGGDDEDEDEVADDDDIDRDNGIAEDEGNTNDENSRTAMMESSESESNEAAAAAAPTTTTGEVVSNGKSTPGSSGGSTQELVDAEDASKDATEATVTMTELTNNGTSVATSTTLTATTTTEESPLTGESLGKKGTLCAASPVADSTEPDTTPATDSSNSSSNGSNKRPLCCDDTGEEKPELSAPKLIKL